MQALRSIDLNVFTSSIRSDLFPIFETMKDIKVIAFDADDTLWINEPYFREMENRFCSLLEDFLPHHTVAKELFRTEMDNLELYGYGVKSFMLSMVETIGRVTDNKADMNLVNKAVGLGRELLNKPVEVFDGVEEILQSLILPTRY